MIVAKVALTTFTLSPSTEKSALARSASIPIDGVAVGPDELVRRVARVGGDDDRALRLDAWPGRALAAALSTPPKQRRERAREDGAGERGDQHDARGGGTNMVICTSSPPKTRMTQTASAASVRRRAVQLARRDHAHRAQQPVARAAHAAAELERALDVRERLGRRGARRAARSGSRAGRWRATRRRSARPRPARGDDLLGAEERLARRHHELAPRRRRREADPRAVVRRGRPRRPRSRSAATKRSASGVAGSPMPKTPTIDVVADELEVDVGALAQPPRELVAVDREAAHVDGQPQRVVAGDAGAPDEALVEHVETGDRADLARARGRPPRALGDQLGPCDRGEPALRRRARRSAASSGSSTRSASRCGRRSSASRRSPPRWSIADWPRLPTILWVLEITRSAPAASACSGSAS